MSYSLQRATSDGTLSTIPVNILYFDKTDLAVYVDDVVLPDGTYTYSWSANNIVITPNVANGSEVLIKRSTKFDLPYHDFSAGAVFKDSTVDDNFKQMLFIAQETSEGATATDFYANLNLHGYRLRKVGNAVEDDDAVPFAQYRADALGAYNQRVLAESAKTAAQASQTAAAASASYVSASVSNAATSATNAANSASSAATSASNASASAAAASTYKDSAAASAVTAQNAADAAVAAAAGIDDANLVHRNGNETINGTKTFTSPVILSSNLTVSGTATVADGTAVGHATTKGQVDSYFSSRGLLTGSVLKTAAQLNVPTLVPGNYVADATASSAAGLPSADHHIIHVSYSTSTNYAVQIAVNFYVPSLRYTRVCNAGTWTAWASGAAPTGQQVFTSSGTFTVPAGVTQVFLTGCGGGGGGGGVAGSNSGAQYGGGGGSGYTVIRRAVAVTPGASITVTIGNGGGGGAQGNGGTGGTTSFGALLSISGGGGGGGTNATGSAFNGGAGIGHWDGDGGNANSTSNGGSSIYGRGALGGSPGTAAAANSGAGGGGGRTPSGGTYRAGGAGGSGYLLVEW